ncbi:S13A3-like protein [Mya arenaria]|uniref:S13A3-like protein n=1 Tax=Mya arenaria TaxID=6604 RepID=A0ABY7GEC0_MYAAR|nr:S13A3-like protein [Mya arenaria]
MRNSLRNIVNTLVATKCIWVTFLAFVLPIKLATDYPPELKQDISMLLLGGLLIALALEETRLHYRISLYVLVLVGAQPMMLMLGAMVSTWLLSFWINNTSATAMMIPIILAVCESVREVRAQSVEESESKTLVTYEVEMRDVTVNDSSEIQNGRTRTKR